MEPVCVSDSTWARLLHVLLCKDVALLIEGEDVQRWLMIDDEGDEAGNGAATIDADVLIGALGLILMMPLRSRARVFWNHTCTTRFFNRT